MYIYCKFDNSYVQSGAVIIILSFSFVVFLLVVFVCLCSCATTLCGDIHSFIHSFIHVDYRAFRLWSGRGAAFNNTHNTTQNVSSSTAWNTIPATSRCVANISVTPIGSAKT